MAPRKRVRKKKASEKERNKGLSPEYIACFVNSVKIKFQTLKKQMEAFKDDRIALMNEYSACTKIQIPSYCEGLTLRALAEREEEEKRKEEATKDKGRRAMKTRWRAALSPPQPSKRSKTEQEVDLQRKKPYWTRGHRVNVEALKPSRNGNTSRLKPRSPSSSKSSGDARDNSKFRKVISTNIKNQIPESSTSSDDMSFVIRTGKNVLTSTPATKAPRTVELLRSRGKIDSRRDVRSRRKDQETALTKPKEKPSSRPPLRQQRTEAKTNGRLVGCSITRFAQTQEKATKNEPTHSRVTSRVGQSGVFIDEDNIPLSVLTQSSLNSSSLLNGDLHVVKDGGVSSISVHCTSEEKYLQDRSGNKIISKEDNVILSNECNTFSIHTSMLSMSRDCTIAPSQQEEEEVEDEEEPEIMSKSIDFQYAHDGGPVVTERGLGLVCPKGGGGGGGLALLRLPRAREVGVSAAGSPLLTTTDVARVLVPLRNGDVVALQPTSPSLCAPMDAPFALDEVRTTIRRQLKELVCVLRGTLQGGGGGGRDSEPPTTPSTPLMRPLTGPMASWRKTDFHMNLTASSAANALRGRCSSVWRRLFEATQESNPGHMSAAATAVASQTSKSLSMSFCGGLTNVVRNEMAAGNITLTPCRAIDSSPFPRDRSVHSANVEQNTRSDGALVRKQFSGNNVGNKIDSRGQSSVISYTPKRVQFLVSESSKDVASRSFIPTEDRLSMGKSTTEKCKVRGNCMKENRKPVSSKSKESKKKMPASEETVVDARTAASSSEAVSRTQVDALRRRFQLR